MSTLTEAQQDHLSQLTSELRDVEEYTTSEERAYLLYERCWVAWKETDSSEFLALAARAEQLL